MILAFFLISNFCGDDLATINVIKKELTVEQYLEVWKIKREKELKLLKSEHISLTRIMEAKRKAAR